MSIFDKKYDVLVVGAGVAGVHAAFGAAEQGAEVLLITSSWDFAAKLAWGPELGDSRDIVSLSRKGPAWRVLKKAAIGDQKTETGAPLLLNSDRYEHEWAALLLGYKRIAVFQDTVEDISAVKRGWLAKTRWGADFQAKTIVLCPGTFLDAKTKSGCRVSRGGRPGETGSEHLSASIIKIGGNFCAATIGAAPIIGATGIRWSALKPGGRLRGLVPGADPSETMVCLQPVGKAEDRYYLRGLEWLAKEEVEDIDVVRAIKGLEAAEVIRPSFSVSYKIVRPDRRGHGRKVSGKLFLAGRVNGSASYAESAAQGFKAGIDAAESAVEIIGGANVSRETNT